jgi:hypothetical protein
MEVSTLQTTPISSYNLSCSPQDCRSRTSQLSIGARLRAMHFCQLPKPPLTWFRSSVSCFMIHGCAVLARRIIKSGFEASGRKKTGYRKGRCARGPEVLWHEADKAWTPTTPTRCKLGRLRGFQEDGERRKGALDTPRRSGERRREAEATICATARVVVI